MYARADTTHVLGVSYEMQSSVCEAGNGARSPGRTYVEGVVCNGRAKRRAGKEET